jgi:hypothetical protein
MKRENTSGRLDKLIQLTPPAAVRLAVRFWENAATSDDKAFQRAAVIFGHFAVDRFDDVEDASDASYRVVVREPLDRMVSHYRFSQQQRGYAPALRGWMSGQDIDLAFPDFALDASVHNFQTRYTGTDPNRYDLIGTVDRLPAFLATAGLIESGSVVPFKNKTKWEGRPADPILNDPGFQRDFQAAHAADYEFYQAALDRQSVL